MKRQNFILSFYKNEEKLIKRSYTTSEMALKDSKHLMHQFTKDGDKFVYNITQQGHTTPITEVYGHNENGKIYYHVA